MVEVFNSQMKNVPIAGRKALLPIRDGEGTFGEPWFGRDGSLVSLPWRMGLTLEGRTFYISTSTYAGGSMPAAITGGGAGTVPDLDQPDACVSVPAGTVIIPLWLAGQVIPPAALADNDASEIIFAVDRSAAWVLDGTVTAVTPINRRSDAPRASACRCFVAATGDITDPVITWELARKEGFTNIGAAGEETFALDLVYEPEAPPVIVGPAMLLGYFGGTHAETGFIQMCWAEFSKSELGL